MLAGTMITMADGSVKPVESVVGGDRVLSYDVRSRQLKPSSVLAVHTPYVVKSYLVVNGTTRVTHNHPFLTSEGWVPAGDLKLGSKLVGAGGESVPVVSIDNISGDEFVYNFQVGDRNYVADGLIVHNKDNCEEYIMYCPACE
jgi:DNA polymerase-3 subunit gamma/tau